MSSSGRIFPISDEQVIDTLRAELEKVDPSRTSRIIEKFVMAVLGSIPWIGGVLSAGESFRASFSCCKLTSWYSLEWTGSRS